jgi:futalosine hydrolase
LSLRLDVLIVASAPWESEILRGRVAREIPEHVGRRSLAAGELGPLRVGVLTTGMGKANTAMALGAALERVETDLLLMTGVGGAYPSSGLSPGDLAVATEEIYGDEGVETADGFLELEKTKIPLWTRGCTRYFNRFPADPKAYETLSAAAESVARTTAGPFVTVSTVTGTHHRAHDLGDRFEAVCENMEGAAAAHAALVYETPFAEVRGISNAVGPRDRGTWRLEEAAAVAQEAVIRFLGEMEGRGRES